MLKKILTFKIAIILGGIIIVMVMTIGIIAAIAGISIGYEKVKREAETNMSSASVINNQIYSTRYKKILNENMLSSGYVSLERLVFYLQRKHNVLDITELSEDDWKVGYIENLNLDKKQMIPIKTICINLKTNEDIPKQTITSGINSNGVLINVINLCEKDGVDISISQDYTEDYPYLPLVFSLKSSFTITSYVFENRNIDLGLSEEEAARTNYHSGWDFAAPLGTPFYSMCNGEIKNVVNTQYNDLIYSESGNATGNYVSVTCNNGFEIVYHHIKANSVPLMYRRGTPVREGILLGNVSTTGLSTGFHLHVGLKINGEQADVLEYVDFNYKR